MRTTTIDRLTWLRALSPAERRAIRERAHLSQRDLAAAGGFTQTALSRWENGIRIPRGQAAEDYARLLHRLNERQGMAS
jgi:DNA-binding transcriptional regulator YiaG